MATFDSTKLPLQDILADIVKGTFAADNYNLRDDWYGSKQRKVDARQGRLRKEAVLEQVQTTDYLQSISMLHTLELRKADLAAGKSGKQVTPIRPCSSCCLTRSSTNSSVAARA